MAAAALIFLAVAAADAAAAALDTPKGFETGLGRAVSIFWWMTYCMRMLSITQSKFVSTP